MHVYRVKQNAGKVNYPDISSCNVVHMKKLNCKYYIYALVDMNNCIYVYAP